MSHQPYETWILDAHPLAVEERRALEAHLNTCQQCQALQRKWRAVRQELRLQTLVSPAPGFAQRWQAGLAGRREQEIRRQAWKAFLGFLGSALLVLLVVAAYLVLYSSPADWLAMLIGYAAFSLNLADTLLALIVIWLRSTPPALNLALWIYATITLGLLSLTWVFTLWRTSMIGVINQ